MYMQTKREVCFYILQVSKLALGERRPVTKPKLRWKVETTLFWFQEAAGQGLRLGSS